MKTRKIPNATTFYAVSSFSYIYEIIFFLWRFLTKTLQNVCFIFFAQQRSIENPVNHLDSAFCQKKVNHWKPLTIILGLPEVDDDCKEYNNVLKFYGNILSLGINTSNIKYPFIANQKGTIS